MKVAPGPETEATPILQSHEAVETPESEAPPTASAVGTAASTTAPKKKSRNRQQKIPKLTKLQVGSRAYTVSGATLDQLKAKHSTGLYKLENLRRGDTAWNRKSCPYLLFDGGEPKFIVDPACICTTYYSTKTCTFGRKCKFWHVLQTESRRYVSGPEPGSLLPGDVPQPHLRELAARETEAANRISALRTALASPHDPVMEELAAKDKAAEAQLAQAFKRRKLQESVQEKIAQVEALSATGGGSSSSSSSKGSSASGKSELIDVSSDGEADIEAISGPMEAPPAGQYLDPQSYVYETQNRGIYNNARPTRYLGTSTADLAAFKGPAFSNAHQFYQGMCCGCRTTSLNYMESYLCPLCCTSIFCSKQCAKEFGHPGQNFICTPHPRYPFAFE